MHAMDVIELARQAGKLNKTGEGGGGSLSSWAIVPGFGAEAPLRRAVKTPTRSAWVESG